MSFRTTTLTAATASLASLIALATFAAATSSSAQAQTPAPDNQWRTTQTTLSTLLQDGYKIVAVVNDTRSGASSADTIFVQRDQSAFKCIDPQQPEAKTKTAAMPPVCYELVPPIGAPATSESK
ncbi:hypothetical protein LFL96_16275 [Paraburkholderia sp. D15]|uniref:hypothetical protein n=1 Tax=Paraburkholderia sp. D15 TaxID=2880218 RepID=UPI00247869D4|nr:hypothetical protein [Paraburkholderia sp. D15]WGS49300.1 hypothetical protein LFL96_16275 [Paraburkholderia sp. D15]